MDMGSMSSDGSGGSSHTDHGGTSMPMVFTTSHSTPLFSHVWTPSTTASYAGTCIFLVFLAIISRLIHVWRKQLETRWLDTFVDRRYVMLAGDNGASAAHPSEKSEEAVLTARGVDERVRVLLAARAGAEIMPWSLWVDFPRAGVFVVQAGVGYLLMLAVMTLNVGYFLSVLSGFFVGELFLGRFLVGGDHHT